MPSSTAKTAMDRRSSQLSPRLRERMHESSIESPMARAMQRPYMGICKPNMLR